MTDIPPETAPDVPGEQTDPTSDTVETAVPPQEVVEEPAAEQEEVKEEEPAENAEAQPEVEAEPEAPPEEVNGQAPEDQSTKRKLEEEEDNEAPEAKKMNTGMEGQPMDVEQMNGAGQPAEPVAVDINAGDLPEDSQDANGSFVGYVACPEALVSKLIGKKGLVIQTLETLTGAKIQVEHQKEGDPKHVRIVAKSQENLDKTKATIKDTLESEHPLGEVTKVISCPQAMVGRIIGRAGQTILSLQQASQAKIVVDQDPERFPEGAPRDVRLIGMAQCVERAEKMVVELMNAEPGVSAQSVIQKYGLGTSQTMPCPRSMVGRVIGKQGDTIKQLQRSTGANIQIDQKSDPCTITITGPKNACNNAMRDINAIISDNGMGGGMGGGGGGGGGYGGGGGGGGYGAGGGYGGYGGGGYPQQQGGYGYPQQGQFNPYQQGGYQQPGYQQAGAYAGYGQEPGNYESSYNAGYAGQVAGGAGGPSWSEEWDPSSQRYYYFNRITGITQWEKPPELM